MNRCPGDNGPEMDPAFHGPPRPRVSGDPLVQREPDRPSLLPAPGKASHTSEAWLPRRLYSLDALRGAGALAVVFFHWQHFFTLPPSTTAFDPGAMPGARLFGPLFVQGGRAVDFFFSLSGFIFFWLYAQPVRSRTIGATEFFFLRFSRLYPLHFATLILVAILPWLLSSPFLRGPNDDVYHFILQLFFASNWGFEKGYSFNGPVWSVSVEILLYAIFFVACVTGRNRWWDLLLLILAGSIMEMTEFIMLGRGLLSFFAGGLTFKFFAGVLRRRRAPSQLVLWAGLIVLWVVFPMLPRAYDGYRHLFGSNLLYHNRDIIGAAILNISNLSYALFLFPLTILCFALIETKSGRSWRHLTFLGDISYSVYLLHYPLQLIFLSAAHGWNAGPSAFYSPVMLIVFFATLIGLSSLSHYRFERPVQAILRRRIHSTVS